MADFHIRFRPDLAFGSAGSWIRWCKACGAEGSISALGTTAAEAEHGRCFVCEPVPARPVSGGGVRARRFVNLVDSHNANRRRG